MLRLTVRLALALVLAGVATAFDRPTGVAVRSPDGLWSVLYSRHNGYGRLDLTRVGDGARLRMYRSNDSCCDQVTWIRPHLLVFVDDYKVKTIDPGRRIVKRIAGFSTFVVSANGRWLAGYADCGGHCAETVGMVSTAGGGCRTVPHRPDQDDSSPVFTPDGRHLTVVRRRFDTANGEPVGPSRLVTVPFAALLPSTSC